MWEASCPDTVPSAMCGVQRYDCMGIRKQAAQPAAQLRQALHASQWPISSVLLNSSPEQHPCAWRTLLLPSPPAASAGPDSGSLLAERSCYKNTYWGPANNTGDPSPHCEAEAERCRAAVNAVNSALGLSTSQPGAGDTECDPGERSSHSCSPRASKVREGGREG